MHGIEEGLLDKGCAEASDLLYITKRFCRILGEFVGVFCKTHWLLWLQYMKYPRY